MTTGFVTFNLLCYDSETKARVFGMISEVPKTHKYQIEGEEEVNRVVVLSRAEAVAEDERQAQMERLCKEWGLNKGLWLKEMKIE